MTKTRAKYILEHPTDGLGNGLLGNFRYAFRGRYGQHVDKRQGKTYADGLTYEEVMFVRNVWKSMPGTSTFRSALVKIAGGK
jgi:hypothetical protein